jgi:nucleoside-diphosphate-sugar epimerase
MPSTLLTGANSFVAAHVIQALIDDGHKVTGTVRRPAAGDDIYSFHPEWKEHLDIVVVEDLANQESWDTIFKSKDYDHVCKRGDFSRCNWKQR